MATRPSFRPRPIDSSKPLPILRTSKDLRNADDVVVSRALPQVGTGVEAAELEERHLQQALLASVYGEDASNSKTFDIPIPVFEPVEAPPYAHKAPFKRKPGSYIMFDKSDEDLENSFVDYDGDHVDEAFVTKYNAAHKKQPLPLVMDALERAMDALEKLQGRVYADEEEEAEGALPTEKPDSKRGAPAAAAAAAAAAGETRESLLQFSQVRSELVTVLSTCTDTGRREVYTHWVDRRLAHGGPRHRLYIKPPATDDHNPGVAFRPRGSEDGGGGGRRMNTYENFKRASLLREEFEVLRGVMESVVSRERLKAEQLVLSALQMRMQCVASGGARLASISRNIVAAEREGFAVGAGDSRVVVSCRGLAAELPPAVEAAMHRTPFGPEKAKTTKTKRRAASGAGVGGDGKPCAPSSTIGGGSASGVGAGGEHGRDGAMDGRDVRQQSSPASQQHGVDSYGYDDHGNRFLKHMRYFAGGFMNYGVCPYDHRVFAAASERNTVKEHACEPRPFMFPSPAVKFGARGRAIGGKTGPHRSAGGSEPVRSLDAAKRALGVGFGAGVSKRKRRSIKVRGRVGRGGRIILDRVVFEPERGVKAASYPASVEMGGVFTAGLPLEAAERVAAEEIEHGALGCVHDIGFEDGGSKAERALVRPLQPMLTLADGLLDSDGRTVYWPSRKAARRNDVGAPGGDGGALEIVDSQRAVAGGPTAGAEELRKMPAYARRAAPRVQAVD
jgi:Enhancer of polycomb-like